MDSSGSMAADDGAGTKKIVAAKRAVNEVVDSLPAESEVGLRVFGGRVPDTDKARGCRDSRVIFPVGKPDPDRVRDKVETYRPEGFTPIARSLELGARDLPRAGKRTIVLVSDGEDTCQPPSPCSVAKRVARGGIDVKIEAIGFRVDRKAERELRCIARAGGGSYRDAEDSEQLVEELRAVAVRSARRYVPEGRPVQCGPTRLEATPIQPGQYIDSMLPDEQCWYAVRLERGETLTSAATLVSPKRRLFEGATSVGGTLDVTIVNPSFQDQSLPGSQATANLFGGDKGGIESVGAFGLPAGFAGDGDPDFARENEFGEAGTYYVRVEFEDNGTKDLRNYTDGGPYPLELLIDVLGRRSQVALPVAVGVRARDEQAVPIGPRSGDDSDDALILALAAGALALVGLPVGAALGRRRWA